MVALHYEEVDHVADNENLRHDGLVSTLEYYGAARCTRHCSYDQVIVLPGIADEDESTDTSQYDEESLYLSVSVISG